MIARMLKGAMAMAFALLAVSCENKELCYNHEEHMPRYATRLQLEYDRGWEFQDLLSHDWRAEWPEWMPMTYESLLSAEPGGVRVHAYGPNGLEVRSNLDAAGGEINISPGENSILVYNNDTEYILFYDMESYTSARVSTRTRQRSSYRGNPLYKPQSKSASRDDENLVNMPDMLYGHYRDSYYQDRVTEAQLMQCTMHPLVYKYVVCYRFSKGAEHVALARGTISGVAEAVYLHNGRTSSEAATVLYDCDLHSWGATAEVRTFGIPDYPNPDYSRGDGIFAINLEVMLTNGKIINFYRDITDIMLSQPRGGVIVLDGFEVEDEEADPGAAGAFDVSVDGWGEFKDVDLEF